MSFYFIVPTSVPELCVYCESKPKISGYEYCSRECARKHADLIPSPGDYLCKNCNINPRLPNYEYCSLQCGRAYMMKNMCTWCKAKPKNHIYYPYCSFECRNLCSYYNHHI